MMLSQMPPFKQFKESVGNKAVMQPGRKPGRPPKPLDPVIPPTVHSASPNPRTRGGKKLNNLLPENPTAFTALATTEQKPQRKTSTRTIKRQVSIAPSSGSKSATRMLNNFVLGDYGVKAAIQEKPVEEDEEEAAV